MLETSTSFGAGERADAGADVHGHAADVVADELALAGVQPGAHLEAERPHPVRGSRGRTRIAARRPVEGGEEAVPQGLDLPAAEAIELAADQLVVAPEQLPPAPVAGVGGARASSRRCR